MTDLVDWYNDAEKEGKLSPVELAALFHYRYIRIHPFEDGNGRIARLLVNYILAKHDIPMVVVRSRKKDEYLEALHATDLKVGAAPSSGARATLQAIAPNYGKILNMMQSEPVLTNAEIQRKLGIQKSAVDKLVQRLLDKHYVERGKEDGSWHVFITPSV